MAAAIDDAPTSSCLGVFLTLRYVQNKKYTPADCKNTFLFFLNKLIAAASFVFQQVEIVFIEVANAKELVSSSILFERA